MPLPPISTSAPPPPDQRVVAIAARERVDAGITGQHVGTRVTRGIDRRGSDQRHVLQIGRTGDVVRDRCLHRIGAFIGILGNHVPGSVHHIGVVALAADQRIVAGAAVQHVVAVIADDRIVEAVAGAVDRARPRQGQVLDIGAQCIAHRCLHQIGAFAGGFRHHVPGSIHHIGVVAETAVQRVVAEAAIQDVVASTTAQAVVAKVTVNQVPLPIANNRVRTKRTFDGRQRVEGFAADGAVVGLPSYTTEVIFILQSTALVSLVTVLDLTGIARVVIARTFATYELFITIGLIYLSLTYLMLWGFKLLEKRWYRHLGQMPTTTADLALR